VRQSLDLLVLPVATVAVSAEVYREVSTPTREDMVALPAQVAGRSMLPTFVSTPHPDVFCSSAD